MRNWFSKVGRLGKLLSRRMNITPILASTSHHTPSHLKGSFILTSVELQRPLLDQWNSWEILKTFDHLQWDGEPALKRITCSCAFQVQAPCLSLSDSRIMKNPAAAPGSYSLGSRGRTDSCSLSCERPDCSGTETGSQVEYRTSNDPTFDRTMRRSHPTGTTRPADFSEENNAKKQ